MLRLINFDYVMILFYVLFIYIGIENESMWKYGILCIYSFICGIYLFILYVWRLKWM